MKFYITIVVIFSCFLVQGQVLDTIYANDKKNVALFFPSPIRQGITGSADFVFTYNREKEQYFGLLQARPGVESNLLAITNDGLVYSYILKYRKKLSRLNYFIDTVASIGNEKKEVGMKPSMVVEHVDRKNRTTYFEKFSAYLMRSKSERKTSVRKKGMKLHLRNMHYDRSEVYLVLDVENDSGVDFEVDYVKVFTVNGNKKRKASYQRLEQSVVYEYQRPLVVADDVSSFVLVLPKFVLGVSEKLHIELKELNGNRQLSLNYRR